MQLSGPNPKRVGKFFVFKGLKFWSSDSGKDEFLAQAETRHRREVAKVLLYCYRNAVMVTKSIACRCERSYMGGGARTWGRGHCRRVTSRVKKVTWRRVIVALSASVLLAQLYGPLGEDAYPNWHVSLLLKSPFTLQSRLLLAIPALPIIQRHFSRHECMESNNTDDRLPMTGEEEWRKRERTQQIGWRAANEVFRNNSAQL
uniref:Transmembrane protein n=1 Tax=Ascaris lumbricoides TaxID=6252 RepID=A0A0M3HUA5_ASCLU